MALRSLFAPTFKQDGWFPLSTAENWFDRDSDLASVDIASFSSYPSGVSTSSASWSLTIPTGANLLVVKVATGPNGANTTTGVTWNGTALTKWDTIVSSAATSNRRAETWYLQSPAAGTFNVVVSNSGVLPTGATAVSFYNASSTTPLATAVKSSSTTGTSDTLSPAALVPGAIFLGIESARSTTGATKAIPQLQLANYICGTSSNMSYDCSWRDTDTTKSLSWSWSVSDEHAAIAVAVLPQVSSGPNNYTQGLSGALSFAGANRRATSKALAAATTFSGALRRGVVKALAATLAFVGAFLKLTRRALAGALSFAGAVATRRSKLLTGALSFSGVGVTSYSATVLADTPVVYWSLDDSGSTFADSSGNGITGTGSGVTSSQSPLITTGTSVTQSSGSVTGSTTSWGGTANTLEMWVRSTSSSDQMVYGFTYNVGSSLYFTSGRLGFNSGGGECYGPSFALGDSNVHHIVAVFYPGQTFANGKIYIDGALQTMGGPGSTTTFATPSNSFVAGNWSLGSLPLIGKYDEFAGYNYELSAAQVLAHYNAGIGAGSSSTPNLWRKVNRPVAGALSFAGTLLRTRSKVLTGALSFAGGITTRRAKALSAALSFNSASYVNAALALSPRLFYKMDEPSGTTMTDYGALAVNGVYNASPTLGDPAIYTGGAGSTRFATGQGSYATVSTSSPASWGAVTFAGWIKTTDQTLDPFFCGFGWGSGSGIPLWLGHASGAGGGAISFGMFDGLSWRTGTSVATLASNTTYFLVATIATSSGTLYTNSGTVTLYVNGVSDATCGSTPCAAWTQSTLYLNHQWDGTNTSANTFAGWGFWDRALTGSEIAALYAAGTGSGGGASPLTLRTGKALGAAVSFAGALGRSVAKKMTAAAGFTGALARRTARSLSGVLSFSGATLRAFPKALTGALSFTGSQTRRTGKAATAALAFVGSHAKQARRSLPAVLSFTGSSARSMVKRLTASLSFTVDGTPSVRGGATSPTGSVAYSALTPAVPVQGDLLYGFARVTCNVDGSVGAPTFDWGTLTGWSYVTNSGNGTGDGFALYTRSASANPSDVFAPSFTPNGDDSYSVNAALIAVSGPRGASVSAISGQWSTSSPPTVAVGAAGDLLLNFFTWPVGATSAFTPPAGETTAAAGSAGPAVSYEIQGAPVVHNATLSVGQVGYTVSVAVAPARGLVKRIARPVSATLGFTGSLLRRTSKVLSAALAFVGNLATSFISGSHSYTQNLTAALTFTGSQAKQTSRALTGALTFAGAVVRRTARSLAGALTSGGALSRSVSKGLSGALSTAGALGRRTSKAISGALTSAGTLLSGLALSRSLSAALSFTGSQTRRVGKALSGGLGFAGSIRLSTAKALAAALGFAGSLARSATKGMSAALGFTGNLARRTARSLSGALSFSGAVAAKQTAKGLSAALSFTGTQTRRVSTLLSAVLSFVGSINQGNQTFTRSFTAALTFTGTQTRSVATRLAAALTFAGTVAKRIPATLTAALGLSGALLRRTSRSLSGALSFVGTMAPVKTFFRALAATLTFTGSQTRRTARSMAATLTTTGSFVYRRTAFVLSAALTFTGSQARRAGKALSGALTSAGSLAAVRMVLVALSGALSFTGSQVRRTGKAVGGVLAFTGTQTRRVSTALSASLGLAGAIARRLPAKALSAALGLSGTLLRGSVFSRALSGALTFTGSQSRRTGKALSGAVAFTGTTVRRISTRLSGAVSFVGTFGRRIPVFLAASLSFSGSLLRNAIATFVAFAGRITRAVGGGTTGARGAAERTDVTDGTPTTSATGKPGRTRARKP